MQIPDNSLAVVVTVRPESSSLDAVKELARANSGTLGFLPAGAFQAAAEEGHLIAAQNMNGEVSGYLLFRVAANRASIIHLCVASSYRRLGIARKLFEHLAESTKHLRGISLRSRRDYEANSLWARLGFAAVSELPGCGRVRKILTEWWYEHPHDTLFTFAASARSGRPPIDVAIDLNVFYDLHFERADSEESRSLMADWLADDINLCITAETLNEIDTLPDPAERRRQKELAPGCQRVSSTSEYLRRARSVLRQMFTGPRTRRRESDLNHVAHTVGSGTRFFVTRDEELLGHSHDIQVELGVTVLRPSALIINLDEHRNASAYYPSRVKGSPLRMMRVGSGEVNDLVTRFTAIDQGETVPDFRRSFSRLLAAGSEVESWAIRQEDVPIALFVFDRRESVTLDLPILRVTESPLGATIARHTLSKAIDTSVRNRYSMTRVTDPMLGNVTVDAMGESDFFMSGDGTWLKINLNTVNSARRISEELDSLAMLLGKEGLSVPEAKDLESTLLGAHNPEIVASLERTLWPVKVLGAGLRSFVVSIRPEWAQSLFDEHLASQSLLNTEPVLALAWENVYYRAPRRFGGGIDGNCRFLWYVTTDKRYTETGCIRACSQAREVVILPAREAYRRYNRLGIYNWQDVVAIANGDPTGLVMAINFSHTELFQSPISLGEARRVIFETDGGQPTFQSPCEVSDSTFQSIYRRGTGLESRMVSDE